MVAWTNQQRKALATDYDAAVGGVIVAAFDVAAHDPAFKGADGMNMQREIAIAIGYHFWHCSDDGSAALWGNDCAIEVMERLDAATNDVECSDGEEEVKEQTP